jgi:transposase
LARAVLEVVEQLDTSAVEGKYSALGQHGYHPKSTLAVWIYASLIGIHHATKVARALETDAALQLCGLGGRHSRATLNRFRQQNAALFLRAIEQTVTLARARGLIDEKDLAVDSVRLRAHASTKAVRTMKRSTQRLEELAKTDTQGMSEGERATHAAKLQKHQEAVALCDQRGSPNVVLTSPSAGLMKFPSGASGPGHRASVAACGKTERFIVGVLVDAAPNDFGKLESVVEEAKRVLVKAGLPPDARLQVAADAGYWSEADLAFAAREASSIDVLVSEPSANDRKGEGETRLFGRERFTIHPDGSATCPAGLAMSGPKPDTNGRTKWKGVGCPHCPLRPQCTSGQERSLTASLPFEAARNAMRARMNQPDAVGRYNRRIATVEPVFSSLEEMMGFRRVSSRLQHTVVAEILLKVLAHNTARLIAAKRLHAVLILVEPF